jgi:ankyrin repeat protein
VDIEPRGCHTALFAAVTQGHAELLSVLLSEMPQLIERQLGDALRSPVHEAATPAVLDVLFRAKADMEGRDDGGETPLHIAVRYMRLPVVEHLLRCAADPWARDGKNISVIDACRDQAVWKVMREELGIEDDWVEAPDASPAPAPGMRSRPDSGVMSPPRQETGTDPGTPGPGSIRGTPDRN